MRQDLKLTYGADFTTSFTLYEDKRLTKWRGAWNMWRVYSPGEGVNHAFLAPQGSAVGPLRAYIAAIQTEHSEPGSPGSEVFWSPMARRSLVGATLELVIEGVVTLALSPSTQEREQGEIPISVKAAQFASAPSSAKYYVKEVNSLGIPSFPIIGTVVFRKP